MPNVFRHDLNGLRAIAVSSVLAYHFELRHLTGGFTGVDVFFVISGFLMTQILLRRASSGGISIRDFYLARARRIIPALLVLCFALTVFGMFALDPVTLAAQGQEIISALLFYSNIAFSLQTNYFGAKAPEHWLLHTWSLSLEWQFYLLYPIAIWALLRLGISRTSLLVILAVGALASFVLAAMTPLMPGPLLPWSFYTLPTRAWELLAGGCVMLLPAPRDTPIARASHVAGLLGIAASVLLIPSVTIWPSMVTAVPVGATALVIWSGLGGARWAAAKPVQWLGRWSYSIYLWHWPLVAAHSYFGLQSNPATTVAMLVASVGLGALSYELIEVRLTRAVFASGRWKLWSGALLSGVVGLAGVMVATHGLEGARSPSPGALAAMQQSKAAFGDWQYPRGCVGGVRRLGGDRLCFIGDPHATDVVIIGDSHAQQLEPRYADLFRRLGRGGALFITEGGCPPLPGVERLRPGSKCDGFADRAFDYVDRSAYKRVVIASIWNAYFEDRPSQGEPMDLCFDNGHGCVAPASSAALASAADEAFARFAMRLAGFRAAGRSVVVATPAPYDDAFDPRGLYRAAFAGEPLKDRTFSRKQFEGSTAFARSRLIAAAESAGATVVDPLSTICRGDICPVSEGGVPLFKDRAHFRASLMNEPRFGFLDSAVLGGVH